MLFFIVWFIILMFVAAPAFPGYAFIFWVVTFFIPPLIVIPIIEAISQ